MVIGASGVGKSSLLSFIYKYYGSGHSENQQVFAVVAKKNPVQRLLRCYVTLQKFQCSTN